MELEKGGKGTNSHGLLKTKRVLQNLENLSDEMRGNENVFEHLPQLVMLLLLILIMSSKTAAVPLHLSSNLVPENRLIFCASAAASFFRDEIQSCRVISCW